jgi:hypothetical protein
MIATYNGIVTLQVSVRSLVQFTVSVNTTGVRVE